MKQILSICSVCHYTAEDINRDYPDGTNEHMIPSTALLHPASGKNAPGSWLECWLEVFPHRGNCTQLPINRVSNHHQEAPHEAESSHWANRHKPSVRAVENPEPRRG